MALDLRSTNVADALPRADAIDACIERAVAHMRSIQHPDGYWWGELESNATMAAEHVMLEQILGIAEPSRTRKLAGYLLGLQQPDGSWPIWYGGPGDVSVSTEAYFALKLAGADATSPEMVRAREFIREHGGVGATRVFTKLWLSLFGQFEWSAMPAMPPEAILFPDRFPFNIYEFASWARATIVPILVVWAHRPVFPVEPGAAIDELYVDPRHRHRAGFARSRSPLNWRNFFLGADALLRVHERSPWKPLRRRALRECEHWIVDHQEADGSWGGIQPPWVYSLIAFKCLGYRNDHPVMAKGIAGLLGGFALETRDTFTVQPCVSPVWDTALAITGLREAGVAADDPMLLRAGRWMLSREIRAPGDWCVKVKDLEPGGWAFEFANDKYPDTDDTAEVLIALRLLALGDEPAAATARANAWLRAMQSANGGWGAFDRDNTKRSVTRIPFADFGATIDPPSEDVTAHIVEWFTLAGATPSDPTMRRALDYLWRTQEPRRLVVRTLGRELRLRCRRRAAGAHRRRRRSGPPAHPARRAMARRAPERRRRLGRDLRLVRRRGAARPRPEHRVADGVGAARAARRGRGARRGRRARRGLPRRDAVARRPVGGAALHRHRLPARLHAQVPPLSQLLAALGARPLPPRARRNAAPPARHGPAVMSTTIAVPSSAALAEADAFGWCRRYARAHDENFTVVSWFLPKRLRPHFFALYAFCRWTDDLGDEAEGDRLALLDAWERDLRDCYAGRRTQPLFAALGAAIDRFDIPPAPFLRLIEANRMDQRITRFETYGDLLRYCEHSAAPVGRMVLYVLGYRDAERQRLSDATCIALAARQLLAGRERRPREGPHLHPARRPAPPWLR